MDQISPPLELFEIKILELQDRVGLHPFQGRVFLKWFKAAIQFHPLGECRESFAGNLSAYIQKLGEPQISSARSELQIRKIEQVHTQLYSHKQLNEIYYLTIRAFDEIYSIRKSYYGWIDRSYDQHLISAGFALRIQALLQRALPCMFRHSERGSSQDSFEQPASSALSDYSDTIVFSWLEQDIQNASRMAAAPKIRLDRKEVDLLLHTSLAISKMDLLLQKTEIIHFVENLIRTLQPYSLRAAELSMLQKKMIVYKYWLLRICEEISGRRHLFACTLDRLLDEGFLECQTMDALLDLFEEAKKGKPAERVERFIFGLEKLQKKNGISFDSKLISQIFLVTRF